MNVKLDMDETDLTAAESKATYEEMAYIKALQKLEQMESIVED